MARHVVCRVAELPAGAVKIVPVGNPQGVGVFNVGGRFYALKNVCAHQGAPLCQGVVTGTTAPRFAPHEAPQLVWVREGEIIRCPWHRWEFDIATGKTVFRSRIRVATYPVHVEPEAVLEERRVETYPVSVEDDLIVVDV